MKLYLRHILLSLCFAGCAFTGIKAQNLIFLSFDYPYKDVQKTLYNVENVQILFEQDNTKIAARHGNMFATYSFNSGSVFNIELSKSYTKAKQAQEAYDACQDYFLSIGAVPVEFFEDSREKRVIATKAGIVYRLAMRNKDDANTEVVLSSKFVHNAPLSDLEGVDLMVQGED